MHKRDALVHWSEGADRHQEHRRASKNVTNLLHLGPKMDLVVLAKMEAHFNGWKRIWLVPFA